MILALTRVGEISPSGSYNRAISEDTTLFIIVEVFGVVTAVKRKVPVASFHTRPKILQRIDLNLIVEVIRHWI